MPWKNVLTNAPLANHEPLSPTARTLISSPRISVYGDDFWDEMPQEQQNTITVELRELKVSRLGECYSHKNGMLLLSELIVCSFLHVHICLVGICLYLVHFPSTAISYDLLVAVLCLLLLLFIGRATSKLLAYLDVTLQKNSFPV